MKDFEIWTEGYAATGEHGTASFEGTFKADTFDEAVESYLNIKEAGSWPDIRKYYRKGGTRIVDSKLVDHTDGHYIWGCQLYDNETDARKSFG
jgi:hypothetical protein